MFFKTVKNETDLVFFSQLDLIPIVFSVVQEFGGKPGGQHQIKIIFQSGKLKSYQKLTEHTFSLFSL